MKSSSSPVVLLAGGVFLAAFILQWLSAHYLIDLAVGQLREDTRQLKIQIAKDFGAQLSRALSAHDDLAALAALKASRSNYPQLQEALLFNSQGNILLHTDPGMMGKKVKPPAGLRPSKPEITTVHRQGTIFTTILVPLPNEDELYFQVYFDESRSLRNQNNLSVRLVVLLFIMALLLGSMVWLGLKNYEWLNPSDRAAPQPPVLGPQNPRRLAQLLLTEMPHAALAIERNNQILAANALALELLNCRPEELEGMHIVQSPLPQGLIAFYQQAIKTPARTVENTISLSPKGPVLPVRLTCTPAAPAWEMALMRLG